MKNAEAVISSWGGGGVKSLRTGRAGGGGKKIRTGGRVTNFGGYFCWGVSTPLHAMNLRD